MENNTQTPGQNGTQTDSQTETQTDSQNNSAADQQSIEFVDIEKELEGLKQPKQEYENTLKDTQTESEKETEKETEKPGAAKLEKEKAADPEMIEAGAEMFFNITDFFFSTINAWLNKQPEQAEDYEADRKGRNMITANLSTYFKAVNISFTPGQALFYSYVVVYGFDFLSGVFIRIKDFFKWFFAKKPKAAPLPPDHVAETIRPAAPAPVESEASRKAREYNNRVSEYRRLKMKPCENTDCDKDQGFNQWHNNGKYCCNSCKSKHLVQKQREKAKS